MDQFNRPVTSREYKLMLNVDRFLDRADGATSFWRLVKYLVEKKLGGQIKKEQIDEDIRHTHYRDTAGLELRRKGFIMRVRVEGVQEKQYKTTLKYRASDRYISAVQNVSSPKVRKVDYKFEEDIIPPFSSKFSHSSSIIGAKPLNLKTMKAVSSLYPGLEKLSIPKNTQISMVNTFKAYEVRRKIGQFTFDKEGVGENEITTVKACLSFWYLKKNELPLIGEFSFDYDLTPKVKYADRGELEQYPIAVVSGTNNLFRILQKQPGWFNFESTTKTAYAYNAF